MSGHSELSPSDSSRWSRCPGSIDFTRSLREDRSSSFAAEGTVAHTIREQCLELGFDADAFLGMTFSEDGFSFTVDAHMVDNVQPGIDEIREYEGQLFVETWVNATPWLGKDTSGNDQGGSLDAGVVGEKLIVISDLKYGMGVPVQAYGNSQQVIYAVAFWEQVARHVSDATDFLIIIDQPRNAAGGGYWRVTLDELLKRADALRIAAEKTRAKDAPLIASTEGCLWCPAANVSGRPGGCPAHHIWLADSIDADFDALEHLDDVGLDWSPPKVMSREARSHLVRMRGTIEKWLERLHADELEDLINYGPSCGFKAVKGRAGNRTHRHPEKSEAYMKARGLSDDQIFTKKLISPSQGEKLLRLGAKNFPTSLVEQGSPKPVMVPEGDDRPAIFAVENEFDDQ